MDANGRQLYRVISGKSFILVASPTGFEPGVLGRARRRGRCLARNLRAGRSRPVSTVATRKTRVKAASAAAPALFPPTVRLARSNRLFSAAPGAVVR